MVEICQQIGISLLYAVYFITVLYIVNLISNQKVLKIFNPIIEIEENNNMAFAFRRTGLYLGISIGMYGILDSSYTVMIIETVLLLIYMQIGLIVANKIVFSEIDNNLAIKQKNIAIGIVEAGLLISTGIISYISFVGEGPINSSIIYFILGQCLMLLLYYIYTKTLKFDLIKALYKNHIPSAILISTMFIALSLILKGAIAGPSVDLVFDLTAFALSAFVGILMLILFANKLIDRLFLPTTTIEQELKDNNSAAMLLIGTLKICIALAISMIVI